MRRTFVHLVSIVVMGLLLVACGGGEDPAVTPTSEPAESVASPVSTPGTPAALPMVIGDVVWATETDADTGAPVAAVDAFATDTPAIIALVEVQNLPQGTDFAATWTLNDVPIAGADMHVVAEQEMSDAWIAFRFTREDGQRYPIGTLGVVITSSDGAMRESSVRIVFPD